MQDLYIEVRVLNPVRFTDEKVEEIRALRESGETVPAIINATELHASILGFRNTIHLTFSPNVVLELGNQGEDAHETRSDAKGTDAQGLGSTNRPHYLP